MWICKGFPYQKGGNVGVVLISVEFATLPSATFLKFIQVSAKIVYFYDIQIYTDSHGGLKADVCCKIYFSNPYTFRFSGFFLFV